jgi:restriction system protein
VQREEANHFFKVRLWTHREIVNEFLRHYPDLPEDIRETIPLKRVWIIDKRDL